MLELNKFRVDIHFLTLSFCLQKELVFWRNYLMTLVTSNKLFVALTNTLCLIYHFFLYLYNLLYFVKIILERTKLIILLWHVKHFLIFCVKEPNIYFIIYIYIQDVPWDCVETVELIRLSLILHRVF